MSLPPHEQTTVSFTVNGSLRTIEVESRWLLSDVIRHHLRLTGTHVGCEQGHCGSCTILLNGEPTRSCTMLAIAVDGQAIETIEGLTASGRLDRLRESFTRHGALQCGFCIPGIMATACTLAPDEDIREALTGHLCRCTGYAAMVAAIQEATT